MSLLAPHRNDATQEIELEPFAEIESREIEVALEPITFVDELPVALPPVVPPLPPGHDLLDELGPVEDLWDACAETVRFDFGGAHVDGVGRVLDEYLTLEQEGTFGELPAWEQQRLIQDLRAEYVRR